MVPATPEQIDAVKTNTDAFMTLSKIAFTSTERLTALNLNAARAALEDSIAACRTLVEAKDLKGLQNLQSLTGPGTEKAAAYLRSVQEIATQTQEEISKVMTTYFSAVTKGSTAGAGWTAGLDMFNKLAQQMTGMAEASIKTLGDTTEKVAAAVTPHPKRAA